ncbi:putative phage tail protein [Lacrimispora sp. 38-1]|uniref:putative phage tail protein n=1 Tax=Lacrimispora sp. 38-1 TaxID=3125778 RepID=UPI003CE6E944
MAVDLKMLLPKWFQNVVEFNELLETEAAELEEAESSIHSVSNNCYIQTADEATISLLEKRFGIVCQGESLDFRRSRIMQRYNTVVPFTVGFLKDRLAELYGADGYQVVVDGKTSLISIKITSDRYGAVNLLYNLLWDILPAHMQITVSQVNTKHLIGALSLGATVSGTKVITI